jgi:hypothetical protein
MYKKNQRISEDNYKKKGTSVQDNLNDEDIEQLLEDYEEVNDVTELKNGLHIRYYSLVKKKNNIYKIFRMGGTIIKIDPELKYLVLSNNKVNWSVQIKDSILYRKMTLDEVKNFYENELDVKEFEVEQLKKEINKLKKQII